MIANKPARLLYTRRLHHDDGGLVEMVIWELPASLPGSAHRYKYRWYYGYPGRRLVGYDNERGKGDHCHLPGKEMPYAFVSVDRLIEDFLDDVARSRDDANDDDTDRTR